MSSKSNARTNKVVVRKLVEADNSPKSQTKKYVVARRKDTENWPDEERKQGMQFDQHGELLGQYIFRVNGRFTEILIV